MSAKSEAHRPHTYAGLAAYFARPLWRSPDTAAHFARLLLDSRWPWTPWWAAYSGVDRKQDRPAVRVGAKVGAATLLEGLLAPELSRLRMRRSVAAVDVTNISVTLGRMEEESWGYEAPLQLWIVCRMSELPAAKSLADWLPLAHELVDCVGAANATIGLWPSFEMAIGDTWLTRTVIDTPARDYNLGLPENFSAQVDLIQRWKKFLGRTYARHPRWGTYLNTEHLTQIGGIERIRADVEPARIDQVGELTYIQLTDSVETALTPLAGERRQRLEALMTPIILGAGRE